MVDRNHARQEVVDGRGHRRDRDLSHSGGRHAANAQQGGVQRVQDVPQLAIEVPAHRSQADASRGALQKARTQSAFQLVDAPAERRLRDVDRLRRLAKTAQLRHGSKGQQVVEIEVDGHENPRI
ncbi:hypothetical protein D3C72_2107890 [compost metagenome]